MAVRKSLVEDTVLDLTAHLLTRNASYPTPPKALARDLATLQKRTRAEGLSFLTKSLPRLGKALDEGLATRTFTIPNGFKPAKNRKTPAFLSAHFNVLFDESGILLETAPPAAVAHLRQVLFFAYKLELPYTQEQEAAVINSFILTEKELEVLDLEPATPLLELAAKITGYVLKDFDPRDVLPRHGPGAVATGERLEEKWNFSRLYDRIHQVFPYYDFYVAGRGREIIDRVQWYRGLERLQAGTAKVVLVPKDSRGPRLISAEPLEYQWIQQGVGRSLVRFLEAHHLTKGRINFASQEVNRNLAQESSATLQLATLDLKDASDRVSLDLVRRVFKSTPEFVRVLEAIRTDATRLPSGDVVPLLKFAPMGSAVCFPVEAFVFWSVLVASISRATKCRMAQAARLVHVYGDDLIIPTEHARRCIQDLESVGLKVNVSKSCIDGPFRESCGMDAFKGVCVTPTRLRKVWSGEKSDGPALHSYVSISNELRDKGYESAADRIVDLVEGTYGIIPFGTPSSGFPCWFTRDKQVAERLNRSSHSARWVQDFQRLEFRVLCASPRRKGTELDGWPRMLRSLVTPGLLEPTTVVIPRSTILKRRWRAV